MLHALELSIAPHLKQAVHTSEVYMPSVSGILIAEV